MTEYKAFSNTVVVFKEPTISQIVPKSGPNAGKETSVLEFKAYKPLREKTAPPGKMMFFAALLRQKSAKARRSRRCLRWGSSIVIYQNGKQMQENVLKFAIAQSVGVRWYRQIRLSRALKRHMRPSALADGSDNRKQ
ncbi:MAG: hypothetical protein ACLR2C_09830 [Parasutterella excrementihominis]